MPRFLLLRRRHRGSAKTFRIGAGVERCRDIDTGKRFNRLTVLFKHSGRVKGWISRIRQAKGGMQWHGMGVNHS